MNAGRVIGPSTTRHNDTTARMNVATLQRRSFLIHALVIFNACLFFIILTFHLPLLLTLW